MTRQLLPTLCSALLFGCATSAGTEARTLRAELEAVEATHQSQSERIAQAHEDVRVLRRDVVAVLAKFEEAEEAYRRATEALEEVAESAARSTEAHQRAVAAFREAERNYKIIAATIAIAASLDAVGRAVCGGIQSTASYRRELASEGLDLSGKDIDHLWPHSKSGVDHRWNYQVIDSSMNRSLGADVWRKLMSQHVHVLRGLAVSAIAALRC